ncbi:MAG: hypothetical protein EXQ91_07025 [Alphaproteobacteria bacterium]|nr:hypothetical protein [Alphaproteobacteria bacterium]
MRSELDPRRLIGLRASDIAELFGKPQLLRREPPAEIWQYLSNDCVLQMFFYEAPDRRSFQVRHVEVRGRNRATRSERECFSSVLNATLRRAS